MADDPRTDKTPPLMRDASVGGGWLAAEYADAGWERVLDAAYDIDRRLLGHGTR